ncbi:ABC transporter permease [Telluribacter sp.]|jgi:putative ABC transport system permease protein|uniref:ABC transporter permease n=1 Tax=Telluribacter sp. TaxID=1978767 RepID=UPI002E15BB11|nr:FtsX-like permease family protein [Telluribacter sp.]
MLKNYLRIALRQLWRNRLFSLLTILGLTVGLAVSMFIAMYVWHELHYDRFHPFAERTYLTVSVSKFDGNDIITYGLHESFGREVKQQLPEVEQVVRYTEGSGAVVLQSDAEHRFKQDKIGFADSTLLTVLGFKLAEGDYRTALSRPGQIVLTRDVAERYFGDQNPVGRTLLYDKQYPLTVSGVFEELPTNSVFGFKSLISLPTWPTLGPVAKRVFEYSGFLETYLVLRPGTDIEAFEKKLKSISTGPKFLLGEKYVLDPLPDRHVDSRIGSSDARKTLNIFLTIALLILVLAVINYVSLTTSRATKRAREVGVRKTVGGQSGELIWQFFLESFLSTTLAFGLSLVLLQALFPWAQNALELPLDNRVLSQPSYWLLLVLLWLGCSVLSGIYPALMLSRFRPQEILKGTVHSVNSGAGLRRIFTTIQFTASVGLLICSIVIYSQMRLLRTKNIGINRDQIVSVKIDPEMAGRFPALRDDVRQWAGDKNVAVTNTALYTFNLMTSFMTVQKTKKEMMVNVVLADKAFFNLLGIGWVHKPLAWDQKAVTKELLVFNKTVMLETGMKGNPIDQPDPFFGESMDGIMEDFHLRSLHGEASPVRMTIMSDTSRALVANGGHMLVKLPSRTDVPDALSQLEKIYNRFQPQYPFDYYFLDDAYNQLYQKEIRTARLINGFTALTLLVAALGLLGLITFTVETRTKEIGIRKVLGASIQSVVLLLSKDFILLILVAILIASPLAWYCMNQWLEGFAYKIDIAWWMYAGAGMLVIVIALLTVSFQSVKAALMNPVKSLRSE